MFESDLLTGNFDVLLANIGVLTASSFTLSLSHITSTRWGYVLAAILGVVFLMNQIDETFSSIAISGVEETSSVLFCLFTHLSHLSLSLVVFSMILLNFSTDLANEVLFVFVSAYWHLVEVVWIVILLALCAF